MQDFDGSLRLQVQVLTEVNGSPVSPTQQLDETIIAQLLSDLVGHSHTPSSHRRLSEAKSYSLPRCRSLLPQLVCVCSLPDRDEGAWQ
jgi:hypothetical protein